MEVTKRKFKAVRCKIIGSACNRLVFSKCSFIIAFFSFFIMPASALSMPLTYSYSGVVTELTSSYGYTGGVSIGDKVAIDLFYNYDENVNGENGYIDPNGTSYNCKLGAHVIDIPPILMIWENNKFVLYNGEWRSSSGDYLYEDLELALNIASPTSGLRMPTPMELEMATMISFHTSIWGTDDPVRDHAIVLAELQPVPEPGTCLLLATGMGLLGFKWRKYKMYG